MIAAAAGAASRGGLNAKSVRLGNITSNNRLGGVLAANYLAKAGSKTVVYVGEQRASRAPTGAPTSRYLTCNLWRNGGGTDLSGSVRFSATG